MVEPHIKPGQKVLLKPNLLGPFTAESAAVTHPEVIRAVIRLVRKAGGIPAVGDSPGIGSVHRFAGISGVQKMLDEEKVQLLDLKTPIEVDHPKGKRFKKFTLARELYDFDILINLPKFKTHQLTGVTGAVKNLFGCVPGIVKSRYHFKIQKLAEFVEMLNDLADLIDPQLTIMDAVWAMDGAGPTAGKPYHLKTLGIGADCRALDREMLKLIEGLKDFKKVEKPRDNMYHLPIPFLEKVLKKYTSEWPVIDRSSCTSCNSCVAVCAAKALKKSAITPVFDYDKCIRCYCCQEFCPEHAVKIKKNWLFDRIFNLLSRF
ncbi:DUF362 domain-containing protein [Candidatus Saganbacteria bacterium]|nr:DUF362 domain-containing protein [Candidatus Saganbacteria bacterium]